MATKSDEPARSDHSDRSKRARIERLKTRLRNADTSQKQGDVLMALLDLLEDEL